MLPERTLTSQALFAEYAPFVWRVLRRLGVREADIEDVCQEVFAAVDLGDLANRVTDLGLGQAGDDDLAEALAELGVSPEDLDSLLKS